MDLAWVFSVPVTAVAGYYIFTECRDFFRSKQLKTTLLSFDPCNKKCISCLNAGRNLCCRNDCGFKKYEYVCSIIQRAKHTVDFCSPICTINKNRLPFIRARENGASVRFIFDKNLSNQAVNATSGKETLQAAGCLIRTGNQNKTMHHKFVIVDNETLIVCSLNWTVGGFFSNFENMEITNDKDAVKAFSNEFQYMWELFK